ncbi:hypothetical protein [uncultured Maribacter sp.]|nr:hypothetical protein [uncultured Maribacter sp.]
MEHLLCNPTFHSEVVEGEGSGMASFANYCSGVIPINISNILL